MRAVAVHAGRRLTSAGNRVVVRTPGPAQRPRAGKVIGEYFGAGRFNPVANPKGGFSTVQSWTRLPDERNRSTVTTFDAAGRMLAQMPTGSFEGECGATDVTTPRGRLLISVRVESREAAGIVPATERVLLQAHEATTGRRAWLSELIPWRADHHFTCSGYNTGPLERFAATPSGAFGVWKEGSSGSAYVVDLSTGQLRRDDALEGLIGNWPARAASPGQAETEALDLLDPKTGQPVSHVELRSSEIVFEHVSGHPDLAGSEVFYASSSGSPAPAGTSPDGGQLFATVGEPPQVTAFILPAFNTSWRLPTGAGLRGNGGGVLIVDLPDYQCSSASRCLAGIDDQSGRQLWQVPMGDLCAVTSQQLLVALNGQLATLDVRTGRQLSYVAGDACPRMLTGGIEVIRIDGGYALVQRLDA